MRLKNLWIIFLMVGLIIFSQTDFSFAQSDLVIQNYQLVSKTRVGRTAYDYVFKATVKNNGAVDVANVTAILTSLTSSTIVIDGTLSYGDVPAGSTATSIDTFTVRINRIYTFKESNLRWEINYDLRLSGTINTSEIGGTGLIVKSARQASDAFVSNGNFAANVSRSGAQLLVVTDSANKVRGLTFSIVDTSVGQINIQTADATSTALALLFLTPYLTEARNDNRTIDEVMKAESFAPIRDYLRQRLPIDPLDTIVNMEEFQSLFVNFLNNFYKLADLRQQPILQKSTISALSSLSNISIAEGNSYNDFSVSAAWSSNGNIIAQLNNAGWRFVNVWRQDLDINSNEINISDIANGQKDLMKLMGGAKPVSIPNIINGQVGDPTTKTDNFQVDNVIKQSIYWITGPGFQVEGNKTLPASIAKDELNAWGVSAVYYIAIPAITFYLGVNTSPDVAIVTAKQYWSIIKGSFDLTRDMINVIEKGQQGQIDSGSLASIVVRLTGFLAQQSQLSLYLGITPEQENNLANALPIIGPIFGLVNSAWAISQWSVYTHSDTVTLSYIYSDITKPIISITNPINNSTVTKGLVSVSVTANDDVGVSKIKVWSTDTSYYDYKTFTGTNKSETADFIWDTSQYTEGTIKGLCAMAYDTSLNESTSSCVTVTIGSSSSTSNILVLTRNSQSLDAEESKVTSFLSQNGYDYDIADAAAINNGLNVGSYKIIYFRTGAEPTGYNQTTVLNAIRNAVESGSSLFVEYYGGYLAQYLGWGTVSTGGWWPVVFDKIAYVKPITAHAIFDGIPLWDPPAQPDKPEQLIWSLTQPGTYNCAWLSSISDEQQIKFWRLAMTYGWYGQDTGSPYCQTWGGCRSDRAVYETFIRYSMHGLGMLIDSSHDTGVINNDCNNPSVMGNAGTMLMKNLLKWAGE